MAQILMLRKAHFFSLDNDLIDTHARTIGATALAVYTALSRYTNRTTGECWPSIGKLATLLDLARNTVKAALRTLEAAGLISIRRRRDPAGDATSHLYTLLEASPQAVEARLAKHRADITGADAGTSVIDPPASHGGGASADLPLVSNCPTSRSPIDPEPSSLEPKRENQTDGAVCAEEKTPTQAPAKRPCPHPIDERRHFGTMTLCTHCYQMVEPKDDATQEDAVPGQEDQAHPTMVA